MQDEAVGLNECLSCNGMNTSCPEGCGRDPQTGELNGGRCDCDYCAQPSPDVAGLVSGMNACPDIANARIVAPADRVPEVVMPTSMRDQAATTITTQAARIAVLEGERDEADRQTGELMRRNESLEKEAAARRRWLWQAKQDAGYDENISFDVVWAEALAALKAARAALSETSK